MMHLGESDMTQVMGIGYLGEVRMGPDGNAYQWVQGIDGLGNPIGFWKKLRRLARGALRFVSRVAPFVPFVGPAVAAGLRVAAPLLQRAGVTGTDGLGALYEASDGTLYQVQGFAEDEALRGFAEADEFRGYGEADELRGFSEADELRGFAETDELRGFSEADELRGFSEADELRGFAEADELRGFAETDELRGFAETDELRGFAETDELRGFAETDELRGFAEADELRGFAETEELRGVDGYVLQRGMNGVDAYVPPEPPMTRRFVQPTQPPEVWKLLW